ncbi:hypothetical protein FKW77_003685 [Venturia effusa]|uniref:Uncharacterized protein n=1 Tax=Venturia effusa TaxID=50376 RepID=A0A517LJZ5_9PEZI|nr:hypothetical protein FKW77_003685 [Venturia effusa]
MANYGDTPHSHTNPTNIYNGRQRASFVETSGSDLPLYASPQYNRHAAHLTNPNPVPAFQATSQEPFFRTFNNHAGFEPMTNLRVQVPSLPQAQMTYAQMPQAQMPQAQMPQAQMPQAQMPQAQMPHAQMPQAQMPQTHVPIALQPQHSVLNSQAQVPLQMQHHVPQHQVQVLTDHVQLLTSQVQVLMNQVQQLLNEVRGLSNQAQVPMNQFQVQTNQVQVPTNWAQPSHSTNNHNPPLRNVRAVQVVDLDLSDDDEDSDNGDGGSSLPRRGVPKTQSRELSAANKRRRLDSTTFTQTAPFWSRPQVEPGTSSIAAPHPNTTSSSGLPPHNPRLSINSLSGNSNGQSHTRLQTTKANGEPLYIAVHIPEDHTDDRLQIKHTSWLNSQSPGLGDWLVAEVDRMFQLKLDTKLHKSWIDSIQNSKCWGTVTIARKSPEWHTGYEATRACVRCEKGRRPCLLLSQTESGETMVVALPVISTTGEGFDWTSRKTWV